MNEFIFLFEIVVGGWGNPKQIFIEMVIAVGEQRQTYFLLL
jgi:hypothetical protein